VTGKGAQNGCLDDGMEAITSFDFWIIALDFGFVRLVVLLVHRFLDDIFMKLVFPGCVSNDFLVLDNLASDSYDCGEGLEMDGRWRTEQ